MSTFAIAEGEKVNLMDEELSLWANVYKDGTARVVGDEIHLTSKGNWFFLSKGRYANFIFEGEVKMPETDEYSNSGFIFRAQTRIKGQAKEAFGYQAEVDPSKRRWSGGLYDQGRRQWLHPLHAKRSNPDEDFKANLSPEWGEDKLNAYRHLEWNKYRIECRDDELKIFVNGVLTTHVKDTKDKEGHIGIQHHGSKKLKKTGETNNIVKFRNLFIQEL